MGSADQSWQRLHEECLLSMTAMIQTLIASPVIVSLRHQCVVWWWPKWPTNLTVLPLSWQMVAHMVICYNILSNTAYYYHRLSAAISPPSEKCKFYCKMIHCQWESSFWFIEVRFQMTRCSSSLAAQGWSTSIIRQSVTNKTLPCLHNKIICTITK